MSSTKIKLQCNRREDLIPSYATSGSSAVDIIAPHEVYINYGQTEEIYTGLRLELPAGVSGLLLPRSSLGLKGITLSNSVGLIDTDYRGEIIVSLYNRNTNGYYHVNPGDRIAQLLFISHVNVEFETVYYINTDTDRGVGGFGSTGK